MRRRLFLALPGVAALLTAAGRIRKRLGRSYTVVKTDGWYGTSIQPGDKVSFYGDSVTELCQWQWPGGSRDT